jgi:hypothetical protein
MVGTSNAAASMSAWWLLNKRANFDETYKFLMDSTVEAKNEWLVGRYVQLP